MSYILDALKKSDSERKQGDVPNLQTIHIPINNEQQAPVALYGLITILLLLLAFLIGWLFADNETMGIEVADSVQTIEPASKPVVQSADIVVESKLAKFNPALPKSIQPRPTSSVVDAIKPKPRIKTLTVTETIKSAPKVIEEKHKKLASQKQTNKAIADLSEIPYLHEMPDYQQQSVPQMTFAGHVYSSNKASRSVIINDVFMSEGDAVLPGINVVEITASGVVFSLNEGFFRMDILQDWSFD